MRSVEPGPLKGLNDLVRNGITAPDLAAWLSEKPRRPYLVNIALKISQSAGEDALQDFLITSVATVLNGWRNPSATESHDDDRFHSYFLTSFQRYVRRATRVVREVQGVEDLYLEDPRARKAIEDVLREIDNESAGQVLKPLRERLSERDEDLLRMRFDEGFSHAEIAANIHSTPPHARVLVHRAVQKLRQKICLYKPEDVSDPNGICVLVAGFAESPSPSLQQRVWSELKPLTPATGGRDAHHQSEDVRVALVSALNRLITEQNLFGEDATTWSAGNHGARHMIRNRLALDEVLKPHVKPLISL